jgi:hypothetical protein
LRGGGSGVVKAVYLEGPRRPDLGCIGTGGVEELSGNSGGSQYHSRCLDSNRRKNGVELAPGSSRVCTCGGFAVFVSFNY